MRERRAGAWELRVYLGRDGSGQIRHVSRMFNGGKRAARRELDRLAAELQADEVPDDGPEPPPDWNRDTTINDAVAGWRQNGWEDLSPTTTKRYDSIWRTHIKDTIGARKLVSLSPYEMETFFRSLKRAGQAEASVRQTRAFLHRACRLARKWSNGVLPNPVSDTDIPEWQLHERPAEVRAPSAEEVRALIAAAGEEELRLAVYLRTVAASGARRGEACALRWDDVDLAAGTIRIDESIVVIAAGLWCEDRRRGRACVRWPSTPTPSWS